MSNSLKEQILTALNKAKQEGQLRTEKIREIVQNAVSQASSEAQEGSLEMRTVVQEAISAVIEALQEKGGEVKEEITVSIEGVIGGLSRLKRQSIAKTQAEIKQLQAKVDTEEQELQDQINATLEGIQETGKTQSDKLKAAIESSVNTLKNSEEVALLQKRYAQLKAQAFIIQANLAEQYGEQSEEVKHYLDEAKSWYERSKEDPTIFSDKVQRRHQEFEDKLGEAGTALAKKERQMKQVLRELWKSVTELFHDKDTPR
jgi:hypothetical protein